MTLRRRWRSSWQALVLLVVTGSLFGCLRWQSEALPGPPDMVLCERAMMAIDDQRFDVARLTFQTLVNTYPDSDYAEKSKEELRDLSLFDCGASCSVSTCGSDGMCFFPN